MVLSIQVNPHKLLILMSSKLFGGSKIPYFFIAFFLVIFAVNIFYIYISQKTWRGVVTDRQIKSSGDYKDVVKNSERQNQLGWSVDDRYQKIDSKNGIMLIKVLDSKGSAIKDLEIRILLKRPTQIGFDFEVLAKSLGDSYRAEISLPISGQWDVQISAFDGHDIYHKTRRIISR